MIDTTGMHPIGTPKQNAYIRGLAEEAGFERLADAIAPILGVAVDGLTDRQFTATEASQVITELQKRVGTPKPKVLTARHLRRISLNEDPRPESLDDDAIWVLSRLERLQSIERLALGAGINGDGPILVEHLLQYFQSLEAIALAFKLSVQTIRGWGANVPQAHAHRAEVLTRGFVRAPAG